MPTRTSFLLLALLLSRPSAQAQQPSPAGAPGSRTAAWREDLRFFAKELPRRHANAYHAVSRRALLGAIDSLAAEVGRLTEREIVLRLVRIGASIGDAHTYVEVPDSGALGFHGFPVRLVRLEDGVTIEETDSAHRELIGASVVRIGRLSPAEALRRIEPYVNRDNPMTVRLIAPWRLRMAEFLAAVGATTRPDRVTLDVATANDDTSTVTLEAGSPGSQVEWIGPSAPSDPLDELGLRASDAPYWTAYLPARHLLYIRFDSVRDGDDLTLAAFADTVATALRSQRPSRLVVDLRRNLGGNFRLAMPLLKTLIRWEGADANDRLFVLTGPATLSAAVVFAVELERFTGAVFAGEPSGGRPNQFGENVFFVLPRSGLRVSYASAWFQTAGPFVEAPWIAPDVAVAATLDDFRARRDPVLRAVADYRSPADLGAELGRVAAAKGVDAAIDVLRRRRSDPRNRYVEMERPVRVFADSLAEAGDSAGALLVHRANVDLHPDRARAHLALAEHLKASGKVDAARLEYLTARRLLPTDWTLYNALRHRYEEVIAEGLRASTSLSP